MKLLLIILIVTHQCFSQEAQINCSYLRTRVVYDFGSSVQYLCMILRQTIDPSAKTFNIVGEHQSGQSDGTVRGILITDSDVAFISKALMDSLFNKFPATTHVEIFHSRLHNIEPTAFTKGIKVKGIMIAFNNLTTIQDKAFDGLTSLEYLKIVNSRVQVISEYAFKDLENLEKLNLQHNAIRELPKNVFRNMYKLGTVDISNNELTVVDGDIFYNSNDLQYIYISYNNIYAIGENFLAGMTMLNSLYMFQNVCVDSFFKYRDESMRGLKVCFENYQNM